MWGLVHKEGWTLKNWCLWTVVLEKTLDSPLDSKEIKPVHPKSHQSWIFIGRTDADTEAPILRPPDSKIWLLGKPLMLGKIEGRRRRGDRGWDGWWYHQLNGHESEQTMGDGEGQGSLACCSPWSHKESNMTEQLNNFLFCHPLACVLSHVPAHLSQGSSPSAQAHLWSWRWPLPSRGKY